MEENIQLLALEKDFSQLDAAQRAEVLSEMSEEAFNQMGAMLRAAPRLDADAMPSPALRGQLMTHMAMKSRRPGMLQRAITARVAVWKVAAALMLPAAAIWCRMNEAPREQVRAVVEYRRDTVFLEKIRVEEKIRWRERVIYREKPPTEEPVAAAPLKNEDQPLFPGYSREAFPPQQVGTSLKDAPELLDFFTRGER